MVEYDSVDKSGLSKRQKLESKGQVLEEPTIPPAGEGLWELFLDLSAQRRPDSPLIIVDIAEHCRLSQIDLEVWEYKVLQEMDQRFRQTISVMRGDRREVVGGKEVVREVHKTDVAAIKEIVKQAGVK
jgi:hypothetical protein